MKMNEIKKLKGIICYYSGSGNTKLACNYIKNNVNNIDFELFNIVKTKIPDLNKYDIVGFATFTDCWGAPQYFHTFINNLGNYDKKKAFVFNTFGAMSGHTTKSMAELVKSKGFNVLLGHSLHTPENFPPMRVMKMTYDNSPKKKELTKFDDFISKLDQLKSEKIKIGFLAKIMPPMKRTKARKYMAEKFVDEFCIECGTCKNVCPYEAIILNPKPVFDETKCYACWACYNHCPKKSIYTKKFKHKGHYSKPNKELERKLQ
jgi:ferredoxin